MQSDDPAANLDRMYELGIIDRFYDIASHLQEYDEVR